MKYFIFSLMITFVFAPCFAQSSAEVRQTVAAHETEIGQLNDSLFAVSSKADSLQATVQQIADIVKTIVTDGKAVTKPVNSQQDANMLWGVLFGIINLVVTGLSLAVKPFREWVDRYLSKSVLTLTTGIVFAVVAYITSRGQNGLLELLGYLVTILGTHFGAFTLVKKTTAPRTEPKP